MRARCHGCGAALLLEDQQKAIVCPYCASPSVVERAGQDAIAPAFVLGFSVSEAPAKEQVRRWLKSRSVFCRSGVRNASLESVRGVYLPAYLYSAVARATYSASIGEEYTRTEMYTTTENGRSVTRIRTVTETEWRSLSGPYVEHLADVLVTASRGLPNSELEAIEPFDLRVMHRYSPTLLAGWLAEEPSLAQEKCLEEARREALNGVGQRLASHMPGDSHRSLTHQTTLSDESMDLVLVPVWVLAARYGKDEVPFRVVLNGQTGEVFGRAPLSALKITLAVLSGLIVLGAVALILFGGLGR